MKKDIILSGVGGQGILSIATVIGKAALKDGLYMKQAEVHGMSQRGGDVQSNLRISDQSIASDLIPTGKCDLIISLEPMEALRYLPYLSPEGWLVTNEAPFINIPNYPAEEDIKAEINKLPHKIMLNVNEVAKEVGSPRVANIVLLVMRKPSGKRQKKPEELSLWKSIVSLVVWELLWLRRFPKIRFRYALSASPMRTWFMETPMKSLPITDWIKRASARLPLNS